MGDGSEIVDGRESGDGSEREMETEPNLNRWRVFNFSNFWGIPFPATKDEDVRVSLKKI